MSASPTSNGAPALDVRDMGDLLIDITEGEILDDLTWPGPAPGEWAVRIDHAAASEDETRTRQLLSFV
jgi:hypothetical protein